MPITTRAQGQQAEQIACDYLTSQGLSYLSKNYSCHHGEIDLIMQSNAYLVFVEVRLRNQTDYGSGSDTVVLSKQKKIIKTAMHYLVKQDLYDKIDCRFDVVAITEQQGVPLIEWIPNAFQATQ